MKEATTYYYCLFDKSRFVRSSQPCISMNFCTEFSKVEVFPCEYL